MGSAELETGSSRRGRSQAERRSPRRAGISVVGNTATRIVVSTRRPEPDELVQRANRTTAASLPVFVGAVGLVLVVCSMSGWHPAESPVEILGAGLCAATGVGLLGFAAALTRRRIRPERTNIVAGVAILVAGLSLVLSMAADGHLAATAYLELLVVAAGAVLRRPAWLAAVVATLWGMWLVVVPMADDMSAPGGWLLAMLGATVIAAVIRTMRSDALRVLGGEIAAAEADAVRDSLTGLLNRRGLQVIGDEMLALGRRSQEPVCCTFIDVDGLKDVNDRYGHDKGDEVLIAVAAALRMSFRDSDVLCRWGGDEFVVLGLGAGPRVEDVEDRLARGLLGTELSVAGHWSAAVSTGRVVHMPWQDEGLDEILERADQEMYRRRRLRRARDSRGSNP